MVKQWLRRGISFVENLILHNFEFPREDPKLEFWMRFLPVTDGGNICQQALKRLKKNVATWPFDVEGCRRFNLCRKQAKVTETALNHWRSQQFGAQV